MRLSSPRFFGILSSFSTLIDRTQRNWLKQRTRESKSDRQCTRHTRRRTKRLLAHPIRSFTCHAIILNLLVWPSPALTLRPIIDPVTATAATATASTVSALRDLSIVSIPIGPFVLPLPIFPFWPFQSSTPIARELSMAERTAKVATVKISPQKLVGYVGDSVTFVAMGADVQGQPAHGAKFTWQSSDTSKLTIDEAGRARLLNPGLVQVIAHAGIASQTALVLIRPTRHPLQTDDEWRADQDSLVGENGQPGTMGMLG